MAEKNQRGANLTQADRERGGRTSAAKQVRDARGQFAGKAKHRQEHHRNQHEKSNDKANTDEHALRQNGMNHHSGHSYDRGRDG